MNDLKLTRTFPAPRELVFAAWTEPDQIAAWWCPDMFTVPLDRVQVDLRVGGRLEYVMVHRDSGAEFPCRYEIAELDPPALLALRMAAAPEMGRPETLTRVELAEADGATELTITSGPLPGPMADNARRGWAEGLDKLERLLGQGATIS